MAYALGWTLFLLPYQVTTGGVTGISAIIYYATGIEMQISYFAINAAFLAVALYILGLKFCLKTIYSVSVLTFFLDVFQEMMKNPETGELLQIIGPGQDFMACVIGSIFCGVGIAVVFIVGGSTGGTDIIAAIESGIDSVLVLSGVTTRESMCDFPYRPKYVLEGVCDLVKDL